MKLFRRLFADKILRFYEGTNNGIRIILKFPFLNWHIDESTFANMPKTRNAIGVVMQLFTIIGEFLRRFIYFFLLIYVPFRLISIVRPLVATDQELAMIFMFSMLSIICGSLANTTLLAMGDRDYLMIKVMLISPYLNFLGKLIYKMITDFIYYFILLLIFGVSIYNSLMLCLLLIFTRPIGEMLAILAFDRLRSLYENRNLFNGTVMAICVILTYGLPLINRRISVNWLFITHPAIIILFFIAGAGSMYFLWWYKYYRVIIREAIHLKHED